MVGGSMVDSTGFNEARTCENEMNDELKAAIVAVAKAVAKDNPAMKSSDAAHRLTLHEFRIAYLEARKAAEAIPAEVPE